MDGTLEAQWKVQKKAWADSDGSTEIGIRLVPACPKAASLICCSIHAVPFKTVSFTVLHSCYCIQTAFIDFVPLIFSNSDNNSRATEWKFFLTISRWNEDQRLIPGKRLDEAHQES